jgi:thymidylate synthase ThyX
MKQICVELQEAMGSDRSVANSAWTSSFDKNKRDIKTDEQVADLVKRLALEGHSTPFESVVFRFWLRIPIFVDRQ